MTDSPVRKRSITIDRHRTSVSLEEPFWDALKTLATEQGTTLHALVEDIDRNRTDGPTPGNLSSALRVYVLNALLAKLGSV